MKITGIVRRIDEINRIVIPAELKRHLQWENKMPLEMFVEKGKVILKKYDENCKESGISRKIDGLGRLVLPPDMLNVLKCNKGDSVEIFIDEDRLILGKYNDCCNNCSQTDFSLLTRIDNILLCKDCIKKIKLL